jgi:hypothetical protein
MWGQPCGGSNPPSDTNFRTPLRRASFHKDFRLLRLVPESDAERRVDLVLPLRGRLPQKPHGIHPRKADPQASPEHAFTEEASGVLLLSTSTPQLYESSLSSYDTPVTNEKRAIFTPAVYERFKGGVRPLEVNQPLRRANDCRADQSAFAAPEVN